MTTDTKRNKLTENLAKLLNSLSASNPDPSNSYKRSLKIVGVVAALEKDKNNNSISYINLASQIANAKASHYSEDEIVRAIKKSVSISSPLRTYFDTQLGLPLCRVMEMLRNFYNEKSAPELFNELSQLGQKANEKSTEFLLQAFELRQRLLAAAVAEGSTYDNLLISATYAQSH